MPNYKGRGRRQRAYVGPWDEEIAQSVALNPRFDDDSVKLYDELADRYGHERARVIWGKACELWDREHAPEEFDD